MNRKLFTYAINFIILIFGLQMTMLGPMIEKMSESFNLTVAQMGSFFTFSAAGFTIAIIFGGVISDRIGKKRVMIWAGLGFASALLLFSISPYMPLSILLFFLAGGLGGVIETTLSAIVADINPGNERRAVTFTQIYFGIGAIVGPIFSGWLVDSGYSWKIAYITVALLAYIGAIWVTRYEYPPVKADEKLETAVFKVMLTNKGFLLLCASVALYVGVETTVWGWAPKYLTSELAHEQTFSGFVVGLLWAGITIGRFISGKMAEKYSNNFIVSSLCLVSIIGLVSQMFTLLQPLAPMTFFLMGLGFSGIWPLIVSQAGILFRSKYTGTAFSLAVAAGGIGGMMVPYLFGLIAEKISMSILFGILAVPLIIIMGISLRFKETDEVAQKAA